MLFYFELGEFVLCSEVLSSLEVSPVIAAIKDKDFDKALNSPAQVIFLLGGEISTVAERIKAAKAVNKFIFIHIDLADGIGKDKSGIRFLAKCNADGIISTKTNLIRFAKELGLITIQRFFVYDSHGMNSINDVLLNTNPDIIEIMPGIMGKIVEKFSRLDVPLIAGGLIETKSEVTTALSLGAFAVSTGKEELWYI